MSGEVHAFVGPEFDEFEQHDPTQQCRRVDNGISKIDKLLAVHLWVLNILV